MKRVLFVDPGFGGRALASRRAVGEEKLVFAHVASAEEALDLCVDGSFDVVVAAHALPGQSGEELLRTLKHISPGAIRFLIIEESEVGRYKSLISDAQQIMVRPLDREIFLGQLGRAVSLRAVVRNPAILTILGDADSLPPLPRVFRKVCAKLNDPNTSLSEVAEVIGEDIVLSTKVLRLANSALFSLQQPAGTITQAVLMLGVLTVSSLVFSQEMADSTAGQEGMAAFAEQLNAHSLEVAVLATRLAKGWGADQKTVDRLFFCGIAHDLGQLVLATHAPELWKSIQEELRQESAVEDVEVERMVAGASHCDIAAYMLAVWGFSNDQVEAIAFHHEPSRIDRADPTYLKALHAAECLLENDAHGASWDWAFLRENGLSREEVERLAAG